ncbi:MAG: cupin domain-containing protein [archaeon]|nr:MAG: cupin domain-containing protein [archaeon]
MERIEVAKKGTLARGSTTPGVVREKAFEVGGAVFNRSTIAAGVVSGWHHHGTRDLLGYVISGSLRLEFGKGGTDSVVVSEGDFFHIPVGLVHRDVNPEGSESVVIANLLLGSGESLVNVQGPG